LATGDAPALQSATQQLQTLSLELGRLLEARQLTDSQKAWARYRARTLSEGMQRVRENLARRSAFNAQALAVLLPDAVKPTYSAGSAVYASVARSSGQLQGVAA